MTKSVQGQKRVSRFVKLGVFACFFLASCLPPLFNRSIVVEDGKIDPSNFEDKIPLVDAVKKACLVSEFATNGSDQILGPKPDVKLEDNFLRSLLVHCRISGKWLGATPTNSIVVTFRRGTEADASFNPRLPFYNLIATIRVNGREVFQAYKTPEVFDPLRVGEINTAELAVIMSLKGLNFPKNPVTAFKRACNANSKLKSMFGNFDLKLESLSGLEDTMKVAPIETKDFCEINGSIEKCPANWKGCFTDDGTMVPCDPDHPPSDLGPIRIEPIHRYGIAAMSEDVFNDLAGNEVGKSPYYSTALAFDVKVNGMSKIVWLQGLKYDAIGNPGYDPSRDQNCSTPEELRIVKAVRSGVIAPWLEEDTRRQIQCLDKSKPLSYKGAFMDRSACSTHQMPYPEYEKGGYCSMGVGFETIVDGGRIFSISNVSISGAGIGITEPTGSCYSSIAVAE